MELRSKEEDFAEFAEMQDTTIGTFLTKAKELKDQLTNVGMGINIQSPTHELGGKMETGLGSAEHVMQPTRGSTRQHAPIDEVERKNTPVCRGVIDYFPDAIVEIARLSNKGSYQHNPGKPMFWDRTVSTDHADALMRHLIDRGTRDNDGVRHTVKVAWRALALLQEELEGER